MENKSLRQVFGERENRFCLLEAGAGSAGWQQGDRLLEIGCASGEAAAYLAERLDTEVTGVDVDGGILETARTRRPGRGRCVFLQADAGALPFAPASFDGLYCEAAFASMEAQDRAAGEYARVLKPGAKLLLHDFALRSEIPEEVRAAVAGVPCLRGVRTMEAYGAILRSHGFALICQKEVYSELAKTVLLLSGAYETSPRNLGSVLGRRFCGAEKTPAFFAKSRMTYCQMLFQKVQSPKGGD